MSKFLDASRKIISNFQEIGHVINNLCLNIDTILDLHSHPPCNSETLSNINKTFESYDIFFEKLNYSALMPLKCLNAQYNSKGKI